MFYTEKFSAWIWCLPFVVNLTLTCNLSIFVNCTPDTQGTAAQYSLLLERVIACRPFIQFFFQNKLKGKKNEITNACVRLTHSSVSLILEKEELTKHSSFFPNIEIGFSFIHRYPFLIHTTLTLPNSVVILTGFLIAISIKIPVDHLWEKQTFHRTEMK